nr:putative porin [Pontibacter harenae]
MQLFEQDVLRGRYVEQRVDTSINKMQNERFWYNDTTFYQHLGNIGTAAKPIFYELPLKIGARYGKYVFDRYAYNPFNLNYYDTRSPYSHLSYIQGQRGEQLFEVIYARNIKPNWNIGVAYQLMGADKQFGAIDRRQNGLIDNQAVKAFTHYQSPNKRYDLFANYTFQKHEQIELGGVRPRATDYSANGEVITDSLFRYQNDQSFLMQAASEESRNHYHALQIFKLAGEDLKLYHQLDVHRQQNDFQDSNIQTVGDTAILFYPDTLYSPQFTDDRTFYREVENVFGVTGNNKLSFYKAYIKHRNAAITYRVFDTEAATATTPASTTELKLENNESQLFVGGQLRLHYQELVEVVLDGEFQLSTDYRVNGLARFKGLYGSLARVLRSPSFIEQRMMSNHFVWDNDFSSSVTDKIEAGYAGKIGTRQYIKLRAEYTNIKRHIFFNQQAVADQLVGNQRFYGVKLDHKIRFGSIHFDNFIAYTNTDNAETIRIPEWLVDSKLYFEGDIFRNALFGQFGVHAYVPSGYFADAYMPVTQQFYLQDEIKLRTYPVIDVFVTADIKNLNLFLKMANVTDELLAPGYFATPYFPGMRRSFIFGIKWMFFD